jgi:catechol 2,3-dioxygenase-like lactoylglutathione lyase family enzyme
MSEVGRIKFGRAYPIVSVTDMDAALRFYRDLLGFEVIFENGTPVGFVILKKDEAEIGLSLDRKHKATVQNVAFMKVDDASALYDLCVRGGVKIIKGIRDAEYGLRTFVLADPDGNRIDIGQPLA